MSATMPPPYRSHGSRERKQDSWNSSGCGFFSFFIARIFRGESTVSEYNASSTRWRPASSGDFAASSARFSMGAISACKWMTVIVEALLSHSLALIYRDSRKRTNTGGPTEMFERVAQIARPRHLRGVKCIDRLTCRVSET